MPFIDFEEILIFCFRLFLFSFGLSARLSMSQKVVSIAMAQ